MAKPYSGVIRSLPLPSRELSMPIVQSDIRLVAARHLMPGATSMQATYLDADARIGAGAGKW